MITFNMALGTGSTSFTELTGSGYAEQSVSFGSLIFGQAMNISAATFTATGTWPAVTQAALITPATGIIACWWNRATPVTLTSGQSLSFAPGTLQMVVYDDASHSGISSISWAANTIFGLIEGNCGLVGGPNGVSLVFT